MATIRDVAQHSGVSIATVSAVVNNADWVPKVTRERVLKAIEAVKYRPNRLAQSLKTRLSQTIGVVVSDLTNPFFTEIVRFIEHALREHDRNLFLCDSDHRYELGDKNFSMLLEKQVDGIVLIGASVREETVADFMNSRERLPLIAIERDYQVSGITKLLVDSEQGGYVATKHLIDQGYQRVAFIAGPLSGPGGSTYGRVRRRHGYERALTEAGYEIRPEYLVRGDFRFSGGQEAMRSLLQLPAPPNAVFAANDLMALGAMRVAREEGIRVPEEIGIVGYDDIEAASVTTPALTTMAMPKEDLGFVAANLMKEYIEGDGHVAPSKRMFGAELVVRESSSR